MRYGSTRRTLAFTLVELLVVVAIIAILASLLLPALSRGTMAARATECRGNLRDVGLGLRFYADEFDAYPTGSLSGVLLQDSTYGWLMFNDWKETLAPYIGFKGDPDTTMCLRKLRCPQAIQISGVRANGQYAYNASGTAKWNDSANLGLGGYLDPQTHGIRPTIEGRVQAPADLLVAGDVAPRVDQSGLVWAAGIFDPLSNDASRWPGPTHQGTANMLFADGHVESQRQTNWIAATATARARWNNDNAPHPETWTRP
jgi:prepilin-type processing-associated H-X9-DG protein/prepilin-type N-terminal cleavage/methylation domain-containing protein